MRKRDGHHNRAVSRGDKCPFSPSCFICPLGDCVTGRAYAYNILENDKEALALLGGEQA